MGLLPPERMPPKKPYIYYGRYRKPPQQPSASASRPLSMDDYRAQWLKAVADNPESPRSFLIKHYPKIHKWLRENDLKWYEANSPKSKRYMRHDWTENDAESLEKAHAAIAYLKTLPGRPVWINRRSVEKYGGLNNLYKNLENGYLPKTQAYLDETLETDAEWRKRKIAWAVKDLYESGKTLLLPQIQIKAAISHKYFAVLEAFTLGCIEQIQK
jgi:hypothetical protein